MDIRGNSLTWPPNVIVLILSASAPHVRICPGKILTLPLMSFYLTCNASLLD